MKARIRMARGRGVAVAVAVAVAAAIGLALAGCGSEVAGGSSPGGSTSESSAATAPAVTRRPLPDADVDYSDDDNVYRVPDNYGALVYVIDHDRFAFTQENQKACVWGYGKLKSWDHRMRWLFSDGGETAGTGAVNRPHELFDYGWSLYRDLLTLTPVPGGSAAPSPATASEPTQTDTEWGRIWDALPAGFPLPPDAVPTETGEGPASGSFAVGDTANGAASFMQTALAGAGFATESLEGPSEDGSYTLNVIGEDPDCTVQVRARPLSGTTNLVVMYAAACPWR
jgi:hypothetical protein